MSKPPPLFNPREVMQDKQDELRIFTVIIFAALGIFTGIFLVALLRGRDALSIGMGIILVSITILIVYSREQIIINKYWAIAAFFVGFGLFIAIIGDRFL